MLVRRQREKGVIEAEEQEMLDKVFEFADTEVGRRDGAAARRDRAAGHAAPQEALTEVLEHPFTRYPVYEGDLDDVLGVLHVRSLFGALQERRPRATSRALVRAGAIMVPETKPLDEAPGEFRRTYTTWRSWSTSTARWRAS